MQLESGRTREELIGWLVEMARETPRMVVGVDCCFSFPAWFLEEHGCATVFEFWEKVAAGKGEEWLHRECEDGRFWGVAGSGRTGKRPAEFCGEGLRRMMRATDYENKIAVRWRVAMRSGRRRCSGLRRRVRSRLAGVGAWGRESAGDAVADEAARGGVSGLAV